MNDAAPTELPRLWWGTNRDGGLYYAGRVHVASDTTGNALCGLPIQDVWSWRPSTPVLCPDCCITAMAWLFPTQPLS